MRQRLKRVGLVATVLAALMLALAGANAWRHRTGLTAADTPAALRARLEPFWRVVPAKDGARTGGAVLLSGCDGVHDNMDFWADRLAEHGRRALILDSHRPRNLDRYHAWRLVCIGQALAGQERAGDLAIALADPATPAGGTVVLGASHGGWTALEFLRLAVSGQVPPGLRRWPGDPARLLNDLDAVVLLYPYCGLLNGADEGDWSAAPPMLMILAAEDRIASTQACRGMAARLRARGARIEVMVVPDADHAFDQRERAPLSPLSFNSAQRDHAAHEVNAFLAALD
ncbi:dienelactone hydrolase family protein [Paracoccus benzoatiresistens]|uniref:Dienelactone hydrolase family protein n=1 Tax=Paracoccus benzoatiresistens TaxID=2997341 RepID=A0ABT4J9W4_9RHOB|nr:dienelactone hydrolase family protein [Paracoccus sp. EF6]MCZ0963930.1 dienelactone hydrolase family protein [Paracoccus sp. EF6]